MAVRLSQWLAPRLDAEGQETARIMLGHVAVAVSVGLLTLGYELAVHPVHAGSLFLMAYVVAAPALLVSVRFGVPLGVMVRGELFLVAAFLVAMCLQTEEVVPSQFYWFATLPLSGGLSLRRRGIFGGLLMAVLGVAAALALRAYGVHLHEPTQPSLVDLALFFACIGALGVVSEALRTHAVEQYRKAAKARSVFFASLSHELRTPMNGVLGMVQALEAGELTTEQRHQLSVLRSSGESMVQLVNDILDSARLESGAMPLAPAPTAVRIITQEVSALLGAMAKPRSVAVAVEISSEVPPWLTLDATRLRQVLLNLMGNAIKFSPPQSTVRVVIDWRDGHLRGDVIDHGIGIEPAVLERLFVPFAQAEASTAAKFGGSGLGLSITRDLCRLMGGALSATSTPGQGSTFHFEIDAPRCDAPVRAPVTTPAEVSFTGRILVVEDNSVNQLVIRLLCQRLGLEVELAADGASALERGGAEPWKAILMDCQLPDLDGEEVTSRLRAQGMTLPIIGVSASVTPNDRERCLGAGMNDLIAKPVQLEVLRRALNRHLPRAS